MRMRRTGLVVALAAAGIVAVDAPLSASWPIGIYGIVERVVFEPGRSAPERVQVWGAFAFVDGCAANPRWATTQPVECSVAAAMTRSAATPSGLSPVERGYLYFTLPATTEANIAQARREWADISAVAGTGQAIGFGRWAHGGAFVQVGAAGSILRVRPRSEPPTAPAPYVINFGIVKLGDRGGYAAVIDQLRSKLP